MAGYLFPASMVSCGGGERFFPNPSVFLLVFCLEFLVSAQFPLILWKRSTTHSPRNGSVRRLARVGDGLLENICCI